MELGLRNSIFPSLTKSSLVSEIYFSTVWSEHWSVVVNISVAAEKIKSIIFTGHVVIIIRQNSPLLWNSNKRFTWSCTSQRKEHHWRSRTTHVKHSCRNCQEGRIRKKRSKSSLAFKQFSYVTSSGFNAPTAS